MLTRLAVAALWLLHFLPLRVLGPIGASLGRLAYFAVAGRRHVCLVNLARCFPELDGRERVALAKRHFAALGRSVVERGILFWSSGRRIARVVRLVGREHYDAARKPVVLFAPHFLGLDAGATRLSMESPAVSVYSRQKDAYVNRLLKRCRTRFHPITLLSRQDGIRGAIREMQRGLPFYYLPDQDYGPRDSVFVPFFGVPAATITGLARVARLADAAVVPVVTRMLLGGAGYEVRFHPAWEAFPTDDPAADARRMNAFIEDRVREMPEQYNWVHKRFKTRPPGEAKFY
ncbi:MAG: lipid A biosynthesis acyltransferase [Burkholderiales bacterium]